MSGYIYTYLAGYIGKVLHGMTQLRTHLRGTRSSYVISYYINLLQNVYCVFCVGNTSTPGLPPERYTTTNILPFIKVFRDMITRRVLSLKVYTRYPLGNSVLDTI